MGERGSLAKLAKEVSSLLKTGGLRTLDGKIAVITGGGSGVGKAMAKLFADDGASVMVVDIVADRVNQVVAEIMSVGRKAEGLVLDLLGKSEPDRMVDSAASSYRKIHILCNNAGIMDGVTPVAETSDELWERVLDTNLVAPFRASRRAITVMLKHGGGVILNTASVA